jgi:hypothetical protein
LQVVQQANAVDGYSRLQRQAGKQGAVGGVIPAPRAGD